MKISSRISRRAYLKTLLASAGALLLFRKPAPVQAAGSVTTPDSGVREHLARLFRDNEAATAVGRKYLSCVPCEADEQKLLSQILADADSAALGPGPAGYEGFRSAVHARVRSDFVDGRVVNLEGWVLSETEVRLCSLLALHEAAGVGA